jgi:hypothetical protein
MFEKNALLSELVNWILATLKYGTVSRIGNTNNAKRMTNLSKKNVSARAWSFPDFRPGFGFWNICHIAVMVMSPKNSWIYTAYTPRLTAIRNTSHVL